MDCLPPGRLEQFGLSRVIHGVNKYYRVTFLECRFMMTSTPPEELPQTSLSAGHLVSKQFLLPLSTATEPAPVYGPKCEDSAKKGNIAGLSLNNLPAPRRNGLPRSREIWRQMAITLPEYRSRLQALVHLINAGACSRLPTVTCRDWRSPGDPLHPRLSASRGEPLPETLGMRVSPELCEWIQGFPVGWTDLPSSGASG